MADELLSVARLRELLHYNPETGTFTWLVRTSNCIKIGDRAGGHNADGYVLVRVDGKQYLAHRLAWLYMTGKWPVDQIDHRNGVCEDNRFDNLRDVKPAMNSQNMRRPPMHNKSKFLGVCWHKQNGKWRAQIHIKGKQIYLGVFDCPKVAHAAYIAAKRQFHEGNTL